MKKSFLLALLTMVMLSSCAKAVTPEPKPFPEFPEAEAISFSTPHGIVTSPDSAKFWIANNLTIETTYDPIIMNDQGVEISVIHSTVEGLSDATVETLINTKIEAKLQELMKYANFDKLPVYPGFYAAYPDGKRTIKSLSINASSFFNANNILSVRFFASVLINNNYANTGTADFIIQDAMNFDLNTGTELTLSDVFVNDSNFQVVLNKEILLKAQSQTDPVKDELQWWTDAYRYIGGFKGIRGDVKFCLENDKITLLFNENYPEFEYDFSTVTITLPYQRLQDILAFGQRFTHNDRSLFTNKTRSTVKNYLYKTHTEILNETHNGRPVHSEIFYDDELSDRFKQIRDTLIQQDRETIAALKDPSIQQVYYEFKTRSEGPYLIIRSYMNLGISDQGRKAIYEEDGTLLTLDEVFAEGFDYRTYIKGQIAKIIKESGYQESYDLDQVCDSLLPSLTLYSTGNAFIITMTNEVYQDFSQDEGDFAVYINIAQNQDILKIKPW